MHRAAWLKHALPRNALVRNKVALNGLWKQCTFHAMSSVASASENVVLDQQEAIAAQVLGATGKKSKLLPDIVDPHHPWLNPDFPNTNPVIVLGNLLSLPTSYPSLVVKAYRQCLSDEKHAKSLKSVNWTVEHIVRMLGAFTHVLKASLESFAYPTTTSLPLHPHSLLIRQVQSQVESLMAFAPAPNEAMHEAMIRLLTLCDIKATFDYVEALPKSSQLPMSLVLLQSLSETPGHMLIEMSKQEKQQVLDVYDMLKKKRMPNVDAFMVVIYNRWGQIHHAQQLFTEARENGIEFAETTLACFMKEFAKKGDVIQTNAYFSKVEEQLKQTPSAESWNSLIAAFINKNLKGDAITMYKSFQKKVGFEIYPETQASFVRSFGLSNGISAGLDYFYQFDNENNATTLEHAAFKSPTLVGAMMSVFIRWGDALNGLRLFAKHCHVVEKEMAWARGFKEEEGAGIDHVVIALSRLPMTDVFRLANHVVDKHVDYTRDALGYALLVPSLSKSSPRDYISLQDVKRLDGLYSLMILALKKEMASNPKYTEQDITSKTALLKDGLKAILKERNVTAEQLEKLDTFTLN